jgi:hypothetical protein
MSLAFPGVTLIVLLVLTQDCTEQKLAMTTRMQHTTALKMLYRICVTSDQLLNSENSGHTIIR